MLFRSQHTLDMWLEEFHTARGAGDLIKVVIQDGSDGSDTGLVVVPLRNATTSVFIQPIDIGNTQWRITIEPQPDPTVLTSYEIQALASELQIAGELCAFLEAKSNGHTEPAAEA